MAHISYLAITPEIRKRYRREKLFVGLGKLSVSIACAFLIFVFVSIFSTGFGGFFKTQIHLDVDFTAYSDKKLNSSPSIYNRILTKHLFNTIPEEINFNRKEIRKILSVESRISLKEALLDKAIEYDLDINNAKFKDLIAARQDSNFKIWIDASAKIDLEYKNLNTKLDGTYISYIHYLKEMKRIRTVFNSNFFTNSDSVYPEKAGVLNGLLGTLMMLFVCIVFSVIIGVSAAIYLEEFAKRNLCTKFIEVTVNNMAAIPSIIYGLLGLGVYIQFFGLPRSSAIVGGLTLGIMILPIIIIASRNAISAVPKEIKFGALAMGASKAQAVSHFVLPSSFPGIMTGAILGIARAIGETAPLIMIGMYAFIADPATSFTDPTTALPVQIYLWASNPDESFVEKTATAIIVLLVIMVLLNLVAIFIRKKYSANRY